MCCGIHPQTKQPNGYYLRLIWRAKPNNHSWATSRFNQDGQKQSQCHSAGYRNFHTGDRELGTGNWRQGTRGGNWGRELGTGNWGQQTGDRELGTGKWGQGTGGRGRELGQGTGGSKLETGNLGQGSGDRGLGAGDWDRELAGRELGTGNWREGTGTGDRELGAGNWADL